jgi:hypothetical protein
MKRTLIFLNKIVKMYTDIKNDFKIWKMLHSEPQDPDPDLGFKNN